MKSIIVGIVPILLISSPALAGAPVHGAKAAGMGTAFVALADDPSAILYNGAGIAQIKGNRVYVGMSGVVPSTTYENFFGMEEKTDFQIFPVPHLYQTTDFGADAFTFGLGLYSPFGIGGRKWSESGLLRYFSTETYIATAALNPTVAWQMNSALSLAVGADYIHAINEANRMINQSLFGAGDGKMTLEADGGGWGFNLGLLWKAVNGISVGLAYRSSIDVDLEGELTVSDIAPALQGAFGDSSYRTDFSTESEFPEIYSAGIAYRPNDAISLAVDLELVRWSSFEYAVYDVKQEVPAAGLTDSTILLDWEDSLQFKIGLDYRLNKIYSLRCGYAYVPSPVPDHTIEPSNPDADSHNFAAGFGWRKGKWTIDSYYTLGLYEERNANNSLSAGSYENIAHMFGLTAGYLFGD